MGILPYIGQRKVDVTKEDLILMMQEKTVALEKLSEATKTAVEAIGICSINGFHLSAGH